MEKRFKVGLVQMSMSKETDINRNKAVKLVEEAADKGANVILLPELYSSQYFCQKEDIELFNLAEKITGKSTSIFCETAKRTSTVIIVPLFEKRTVGLYHNSLVVVNSDGEIIGVYRKMHIPDDPSFYEKFYFAPGDLGFKVFDTEFGKLGTLICWDQWFPEGARITTLMGAIALFYPTAIGWHPYEKEKYGETQREAWKTVQRGHAIANGLYVCVCNRTGFEKTVETQGGIEFWGSSFITDPQGVIIAEAPIDKEAVIVAEIDIDHIEEVRRNWPFLRDRRTDHYGDIAKLFIDQK